MSIFREIYGLTNEGYITKRVKWPIRLKIVEEITYKLEVVVSIRVNQEETGWLNSFQAE